MAKLESTLKNMLISLGGIALVCALLLAVVNALTEKKIARVEAEKTARAIARVVPEFEGEPVDTLVVLGDKEYTVHKAMVADSTVGYAIESVSSGFGGPINMMVGFTSDGRICSTAVISHSETPGLGAKITDEESHFRTQFAGKSPADYRLVVTKDGGDVDAITASTITSRAFTAAVANAYNVYLAVTGTSDAVSSATPQAGEGESDE
jgi:electron transport complex protein RnfG